MFYHEGRPAIEPGICFICEQVPDGYVDTLRDFEPGYATHITGRKVVCTTCIRQMGGLVGLKDAKALHTRVQNLEAKIEEYEGVFDAIGKTLVVSR